jgi:Transposase domain (DUF772)
MRGDDNQQEGMFSYVSPEKRVPADHPPRPIRKMVDEILKEMSPQFAKLYSDVGRPSIAPERLFRSLLLQIFYSVRSERMLIEQLQYNLLMKLQMKREALEKMNRLAKRNAGGFWYRVCPVKAFGTVLVQSRLFDVVWIGAKLESALESIVHFMSGRSAAW